VKNDDVKRPRYLTERLRARQDSTPELSERMHLAMGAAGRIGQHGRYTIHGLSSQHNRVGTLHIEIYPPSC
jgi:hypothetical protein